MKKIFLALFGMALLVAPAIPTIAAALPQTVNLWSDPSNWISGTAVSTDSAAHTIINSPGGAFRNWIHSIQCYRSDTGTSAVVITFNDTASTTMVLPAAGANFAGSGAIGTYEPPIGTAAATAFTFTVGSGVTSVYCNAQGFRGS